MTKPPEHDERVEVARTAACEEVAEDLPDAARVVREGGDLASHYPDLARHLEECEWCRATLDELVKEPDVLSEPEIEAHSSDVFDGYMAAALEGPEPSARVNAAERAAEAEHVGPATLEALASRAAEDPEREVREAALKALDELDAAVSIPKRLIEAWSASPEEAVPFIEGVLARLAGDRPPVTSAVAELAGSTSTPDRRVSLAGKEGITASLSAEEGELRLTVEGLPASFEKTTPVVAVPGALRATVPEVDWYGKEPGLVSAEAAVQAGRLDVRLGRMLDPTAEPKLTPELERLFVLNPEASREKT
jgi:hypothetical protein